jgi:tripartite ATP-independent transporter DctM subunit
MNRLRDLAASAATVLRRVEAGLLILALALLAALPLAEALGRRFGGLLVPGAAEWIRLLVLWLTFVGGLYATARGRHLTLSTTDLLPERALRWGRLLAGFLAAGTCAVLAYASWELVLVNREEGKVLPAGLPVWVAELVMPVCLALMAVRFALKAGPGLRERLVAAAGIPAFLAVARWPEVAFHGAWPLGLLIAAALAFGAPVFVGMASLALVFFLKDGSPPTAVSVEIYRLVSSPTLPAIPLLIACGFVLAESQAPQRLLRFFRALLGWMPGGLALIAIAVCTLFTTFTGGSGVTVVALGGLLYPMLRQEGYPEGFSLGLVTACGCLGLLFPPSLPVILYSVVAGAREHNVPANALYLAGALPGLLMVGLVAAYSVAAGVRARVPRHAFAASELGRAFCHAKFELALPVLVSGLFLSGLTSTVEAAAVAMVYAIVVEYVVHRPPPGKQASSALLESASLTGSVLMLLSAAMGITSYIVDAMIADQIVAWVRAHVATQAMFLLALNGLLVVAGCLFDEYSAIVVLSPIIASMGEAFGVHPVHLGVIFLANLGFGFLTPPVGLCLFLASSRFQKPLAEVIRATVPFTLIMAATVLLVTYAPVLTVGVLELFGLASPP